MKTFFRISLISIMYLCLYRNVYAQDLVYTPINPSFVGGNPFNAAWLFNEASAQNTFTEQRASTSTTRDPLEEFKTSLERQILNQISRGIVSDLFGEETLGPGEYTFGDFLISIGEGADGLTINIFDYSTGNETNLIVPYF